MFQEGIDEQFFILMNAFDENLSWYLDDNIAKYTSETVDKNDGDFIESNFMRGKENSPLRKHAY